jgi:EAL domain-containing protein (putative c-di-GMP-specific phosphodiesterase class I)
VAVAEIGERGVEELLRKADLAMYRAKLGGRARLEVYSPAHEGDPGNSTGRAAWFARAEEQREEVASLLEDPDAIRTVLQPVMDLRTGLVAGYEALMRVERVPRRGPDVWLAQAHRNGLGYALEARAIATALEVPDRPAGRYLALNMSPSSLASEEILRVLPEDLTGIVIEITENELVSDDPALHDALDALRRRGARIAVDDTGAGYAGLTHVVRLRPDIIKLDRALTVDVDSDPAKAALVASFVRYAEEIDAVVCAEGIETLSELERLADLDVAFGQGFGIARPQAPWAQPAETARDACRRAFAASFAQGPRGTGSSRARQLEHLARHLSDVASVQGLADVLPVVARTLQADVASIDPPLPPRHTNGRLVVDEPGAEPEAVSELRAGGYHSSLAVPIAQRGTVLGSLTLARFSDRPWSRSEISRARVVAPQLATALARAEAAA